MFLWAGGGMPSLLGQSFLSIASADWEGVSFLNLAGQTRPPTAGEPASKLLTSDMFGTSQEKMARKPKTFSVGPFTAVVGFSWKKRTERKCDYQPVCSVISAWSSSVNCGGAVLQRPIICVSLTDVTFPTICHLSSAAGELPSYVPLQPIVCRHVFYLSAGTPKATCAIVQHMHVCLFVTFPSNERVSLERWWAMPQGDAETGRLLQITYVRKPWSHMEYAVCVLKSHSSFFTPLMNAILVM